MRASRCALPSPRCLTRQVRVRGPATLNIEYPMLFEIANQREGRVSHCGVLEFIAEEGVVYLPYWVRRGARTRASMR